LLIPKQRQNFGQTNLVAPLKMHGSFFIFIGLFIPLQVQKKTFGQLRVGGGLPRTTLMDDMTNQHSLE
jgi:hypothetical protein